jgi:hypothetical protein
MRNLVKIKSASALTSMLALFSFASIVQAQTSMKVTEGPPKLLGKICEVPGSQEDNLNSPKANNPQARFAAGTQTARITYKATWSVISPGIISFCVQPGVSALTGGAWNSPITLLLEDARSMKQHPQENPNNPGQFPTSPTPNTPSEGALGLPEQFISVALPPQNYVQRPPVLISIPTPIAAGTTSAALQPTCVNTLEWYKRPRLVLRETVTGATCPVEFGSPAFVNNPRNKGK